MNAWQRLVLALAITALAGCDDSSDDSLVVTQDRNGETVALATGEILTVELAGNPTTGYEWTVARLDATFLRLTESGYSADSSAIGAGGRYAFRFEALRPGDTLLGLVYRRAWETSSADQGFTLTVHIE